MLFLNAPTHTLWEEMRSIWSLPTDEDISLPMSSWFQSMLICIPDHMIDTTLLVAWRAWYARNEATQPTTSCSRRLRGPKDSYATI
jgi:hypothetical protein